MVPLGKFNLIHDSPINDLNRTLLADIRADLDARGLDVPVYWGNRNWDPYLADVMEQTPEALTGAAPTVAAPSENEHEPTGTTALAGTVTTVPVSVTFW